MGNNKIVGKWDCKTDKVTYADGQSDKYEYTSDGTQIIKIAQDLGYYLGFTVEPQSSNYSINVKEGFNALSIPRIRIQGQQLGEVGKFI